MTNTGIRLRTLARGRMVTLAAVLVIVATHGYGAAGAPVPQTQIKPIKEFEKLQLWSRLVWDHKLGEFDSSARTITAWDESDLSEVKADISAIVTLVQKGQRLGAAVRYLGVNRRPRSIKMADVPNLLSSPGDRLASAVDEAGIKLFMKLAAMLHADVAMLSPPRIGLPTPRTGSDRSAPAGRIQDGEVTGWDPGPIHWEIGRIVLAGVRPVPTPDPLVAAWYRASSAYLLSQREYGYLAPHLAQGRATLPEDAHLHVYDGVLHEAYASSVVQEALEALSSKGFRPTAKSAADELEQAEGYFRRALELDPALDIARVHLGRVLGLRGHHEQAVSELRRALSSLTDGRQRYYAELFLGAEEQAAGRMAEAKSALERAGSLFPDAQSPRLALGQLAWHIADRAGAQAAFERLAALPKVLADREDPWWTYPVSAVLDTATLVEKMRELVAEHYRK